MAKQTTGRIDRTTVEERQQVALLKASGLSNRQIARQKNRARQTIASILASEDVDRLRLQARDILDRNMVPVSEQFLEAIKIGASKGSGDNAYRALLSLGVISRPDDGLNGPRVIVNIGQVVTPDRGGLPKLVEIIKGQPIPPDDDDEGSHH